MLHIQITKNTRGPQVRGRPKMTSRLKGGGGVKDFVTTALVKYVMTGEGVQKIIQIFVTLFVDDP